MQIKNIAAAAAVSVGALTGLGASAQAAPAKPTIVKAASCNSRDANGVIFGKILTLQWVPVTWWLCLPATVNTKAYTITSVQSVGFQLLLDYPNGKTICFNHGASLASGYQHPNKIQFTATLAHCGAVLLV